jgi:3-ketosteroid 9alpha-monooxygenase subunit B
MVHGHEEYHSLVIAQVIEETADSRSFVLEIPAELAEAFAYRAGQFCTFEATIGGEQVVRSYSMASSPEVGEPFKTTVKRVPEGLMSNWMIDELHVGDVLQVLRPAGLFVLRDTKAPIVAFAGGSGITPVISIIKTALATTTRSISLIYANRDEASIIFADELDRLVETSAGRLSVHHHLDEAKGFLDASACVTLIGERSDADFYVCGPGAFMDTVEEALEKIGIRQDQLFIERFALPDEVMPITESSATETVTIKLERKKTSVDYRMGDTILDTARRGGLRPPYSCEAGNCATCMALLEKGAVTMRANNALTPSEVEEGWVLTCQSVPTSAEIVINYDA